MKRIIGLLAILLLGLAAVAQAADNDNWTITKAGPVINCAVGASHSTENLDVGSIATWTYGIYLTAIIIKTTATNDVIKIRDGSATGPFITPGPVDITGAGQAIYFNGKVKFKPYIKWADLTVGGTATNLSITFIGGHEPIY